MVDLRKGIKTVINIYVAPYYLDIHRDARLFPYNKINICQQKSVVIAWLSATEYYYEECIIILF